jgi:hypothetical protein
MGHNASPSAIHGPFNFLKHSNIMAVAQQHIGHKQTTE